MVRGSGGRKYLTAPILREPAEFFFEILKFYEEKWHDIKLPRVPSISTWNPDLPSRRHMVSLLAPLAVLSE